VSPMVPSGPVASLVPAGLGAARADAAVGRFPPGPRHHVLVPETLLLHHDVHHPLIGQDIFLSALS